MNHFLPLNIRHYDQLKSEIPQRIEEWVGWWFDTKYDVAVDLLPRSIGGKSVTKLDDHRDSARLNRAYNFRPEGRRHSLTIRISRQNEYQLIANLLGVSEIKENKDSELFKHLLEKSLASCLSLFIGGATTQSLETDRLSVVSEKFSVNAKETLECQASQSVVVEVKLDKTTFEIDIPTSYVKSILFTENSVNEQRTLESRQRALAETQVVARVSMNGLTLSLQDIFSLKPGDVLSNRLSRNKQLEVSIGKNDFNTTVCQLGKHRDRLAIKFN